MGCWRNPFVSSLIMFIVGGRGRVKIWVRVRIWVRLLCLRLIVFSNFPNVRVIYT